MRAQGHVRRAEMMDEMMSRTLLASFFFLSLALPPLVGLPRSACFDLFPRPPGVG